MKLRLYYPVKPFSVNQPFGANDNPLYATLGLKGHNGIDMFATLGETIYAAHDGIVIANYLDVNGGWTVGLRTLEQYDWQAGQAYFKSIYCHMKEQSTLSLGQQIQCGDVIGFAGATGAATGVHLHFGLKPQYRDESNGTLANADQNNGYFGAIDPAPYLTGTYAQDVPTTIALTRRLIILLQGIINLLKR